MSKYMRLKDRLLGSPSFCGQCLRNNMFYRMKFSARFLFEILLLMVHMHFFFSARLHELMRVRGVGGFVCGLS